MLPPSTSLPGGAEAGFSAISREAHFLCDEEGLVVWVNERAAAWFPGVRGRPFWSLAVDESAARNARRVAQNGAHSEAVPVRALASTGPMTLSLRTARHTGCVLVAAVSVPDESLEVLALVDAGRRKDAFMATLAHELRNPLAAIAAALALLERERPTGERLSNIVALASRQTRHLAALVGDYLDIARAHTGKMKLERAPVDLREVVKEAIDVTAAPRHERQQRLVADLPADPVVVEGDRRRLLQVVINLLDNASKYSAELKTVSVRLRAGAGAGVRKAVLAVTDQGQGIAPDLLPRIFDLFVQDQSTGSETAGLGIGLTLVRTFCELHGGRVWAESGGVGRGATLLVELPLADHVEVPARKAAPTAHALPQRILLVEDNEDQREVVTMFLESRGHAVVSVADGAAAIAQAKRVVFDVAFIDIGLPDMDGFAVAETLRSELGDGPRLFALSGHGSPEDRARSRAAGFDGHLVKPVDPETLATTLSPQTFDGSTDDQT